jgi:predicted glycosyltransferase
MAYLHSKYFSPDASVLNYLNINRNEKYAILRFNAFDAAHDTNRKGIPHQDKKRMVKELNNHIKVFISSEKALPSELIKYELTVPVDKIHDAIYYLI